MMDLERQNPAAAHWTQEQYESATSGEAHARRFAWVVENESGEASKVVAFLVAHEVDAEWELENMAVAMSVRLRGIGTLLLGKLIEIARAQNGDCIFLEVRASNKSARALYQKVGFKETGLRKSYYANPAENAILYRLTLH
ncbi:MAG: ribosomal protein S18P -alanine acetyltransferase [Candidatus Sulfotelmatobacter sp.]|nr:ribosomal protein S18P -alanine acetyltransferase [Candidatus Sulfotelmatobacter sp.]